jgi:hypothetical protein
MGMGYYSTFALNLFSRLNQIKVISVEQNKKYFDKFAALSHEYHQLIHVQNYDSFDLENTNWDVVFIDHGPTSRRVVDIRRLKDSAAMLIIHDTESRLYRYDEIWNLFKFRYDFKALRPWTTAVSNDAAKWDSTFAQFSDSN